MGSEALNHIPIHFTRMIFNNILSGSCHCCSMCIFSLSILDKISIELPSVAFGMNIINTYALLHSLYIITMFMAFDFGTASSQNKQVQNKIQLNIYGNS